MVKGDLCRVELGNCDDGCSSRCAFAHGGKTFCEAGNKCACYYSYKCPHTPFKTCRDSFDHPAICTNKECDSFCHAKFQTADFGYCVNDKLGSFCLCQYKCQ